MSNSIVSRLSPDDINLQPFPHVVASPALDPDYYEELAACYPSVQRVAGLPPHMNNCLYLLPAKEVIADTSIPEIWRDFFRYHCSSNFLWEILQFWNEFISGEYPRVEEQFGKPAQELTVGIRSPGKEKADENRQADVMLDCQFGVNTPVTEPSSVRGPHTDRIYKLFAGLLYFRLDEDDSRGGDLDFYRFKAGKEVYVERPDVRMGLVERVLEIPYRKNTFVMWLNTPRSLHGVSQRSVTDHPRRYVNFMGEFYRLTTDGFFSINRPASREPMAGLAQAFRRMMPWSRSI